MVDSTNALIDRFDRFVITTHTRPDGDAIGSQLALGRLLTKLGKQVLMINADSPARNLEWLPGADDIAIFDGSIAQREEIIAAHVIAVVDTNTEDRLGTLGEPIRNAPAIKLLIDHHPYAESWFDHEYVRETASSTGQLVFEIIEQREVELLDAELATNLYVAIMTDTGSFRFSNMSSSVHRVTATLIDSGGLRVEDIHQRLYDTRTLGSLRLLSASLATATLRYGGRLGYMVISKHMLQEAGADRDDTEGLVNYVLSIDDVEVALLFFETEAGTKVSFRSKGTVHVHDWARSLGGGGHRMASGAFVRMDVDHAIKKVISLTERFAGWDSKGADLDDLTPEDRSYLSTLMEEKARDTR
jgi:phosphoesterase RecJ-like protein